MVNLKDSVVAKAIKAAKAKKSSEDAVKKQLQEKLKKKQD